MIKNGQLNELENALLAAQETKALSPELIRKFASRTVTEHLQKNNYDAAIVRKSSLIYPFVLKEGFYPTWLLQM